jgi:hypothetical protein
VATRRRRGETVCAGGAQGALLGGPSTSLLGGDLKLLLKIFLGFFALIGVAYVIFGLFVSFFLPPCNFVISKQAVSPNGQYSATFEQTICRDHDKSQSRILLGKRGSSVRPVLVELKGTTEVGLTWSNDDQLVVSYPSSAVAHAFDTSGEWPRITIRHTDEPR